MDIHSSKNNCISCFLFFPMKVVLLLTYCICSSKIKEKCKKVYPFNENSIESKFLHQLYFFFLDRIDVLDLIRTESCWLLIVYFCKILGLVSCTKVSLNEDYRVC